MYSICITGHGKDKKVHEVFSNSFERSEFSSNIIAKMFDDLTGAPFFCIPDMMHINNDTGADSCFWFYSDECVAPSRVARVLAATAWVEGWIARDMQQLCMNEEDDESDESDDGKRNNLASKYNDLASKYNELTSKYNALASLNGPVIITDSENENPIKRRKLFF